MWHPNCVTNVCCFGKWDGSLYFNGVLWFRICNATHISIPWHHWDVVCASHCHIERRVNIPPLMPWHWTVVFSHLQWHYFATSWSQKVISVSIAQTTPLFSSSFFPSPLFDIVLPYHTCKGIILATQLWLQAPLKWNMNAIASEISS